MANIELSATSKALLDGLCVLAERNGWNAAINACRRELPPEYSIRLRHLYKLDEPTQTTGMGETQTSSEGK